MRAIGALVLAAGIVTLGAVLWVRSALGDFRVAAVEATWSFGLGGPGVEMVVTGHNPLPFAVTATRARVLFAAPGKPAQVEFGLNETARFPPGDFRVPIEVLVAGMTNVAVGFGEAGVPQGGHLGFVGTLAVRVGPIGREVPFKGAIRLRMKGE